MHRLSYMTSAPNTESKTVRTEHSHEKMQTENQHVKRRCSAVKVEIRRGVHAELDLIP